jgi:type II secretion system protein H
MRTRGFTLIETLCSTAIVAVVATGGVLATASLAATLRVATTARTLGQTMRATRARAMAEGTPLEVRFDATAGRWSIHSDDGMTRQIAAIPESVRFASLPARAVVRFTPTGTADNATIVLAAGPSSARIVVNQRGRVRLG